MYAILITSRTSRIPRLLRADAATRVWNHITGGTGHGNRGGDLKFATP